MSSGKVGVLIGQRRIDHKVVAGKAKHHAQVIGIEQRGIHIESTPCSCVEK